MAGDAAERAHGAVLEDAGFAEDRGHLLAPEAQAAVLFEGGHVGEDAASVFEEAVRPLDGFGDLGDGLVEEMAEVNEDGLGEGLGFADVKVDARV